MESLQAEPSVRIARMGETMRSRSCRLDTDRPVVAPRAKNPRHAISNELLRRKAQNFSYWMTSMLREQPDTNPFERMRRLRELDAVVNSRYNSAYRAEAYTGRPTS